MTDTLTFSISRNSLRTGALAVSLLGLGYFAGRAGAAIPADDTALTYTGFLTEAGVPVEGTRPVAVELHNTPTGDGTAPVCRVSDPALPVVGGRFKVKLTPAQCTAMIRAGGDTWAEVRVNDVPVGPRTKLGAVPYAMEAAHAEKATVAAGAADALATRLDTVDTDMGGRLKNGGWGSLAHLPLGSSNPTWGSQMMWQAGADVVDTVAKTGGAGNSMAVINFPTAFPHGVVTVLGTFGDTGFSLANLGVFTTTTSSVTFSLDAMLGSHIRINWLAIGY